VRKLILISFAVVLCGCSSYPQTREEFRKSILGGSGFSYTDTYTSTRRFDDVVRTLKQKTDECLQANVTTTRTQGGMNTMNQTDEYRTTVRIVDKSHAELTSQIAMKGAILTEKMPSGGYYKAAMDIQALSATRTKLTYYGDDGVARTLGYDWRERAQPFTRAHELTLAGYAKGLISVAGVADIFGVDVDEMHTRLRSWEVSQQFDESDALLNAANPVRAKTYEHTNMAVGIDWGFGAWRFAGQFIKAGEGSCSLTSGASCSTAGLGATMYTLGARYRFDRQTFLYTIYAHLNNGVSAAYNNNSGIGLNTGTDTDNFAIGVSYSF